MRLVHVSVPRDRAASVRDALDGLEVDYASVEEDDGEHVLFEFPLPSGGLKPVLSDLRDAGVREETYVVLGGLETALTPNIDALQDRYASDYSPLPTYELKSKARSLSRDFVSYVSLLFLSAVIAAVGLLTDSPAVVVGSMVIAPVVGPTLTASVGVITGDAEMLFASARFQALAVVVAVVGALLAGLFLRWMALVPPDLDVTSLSLVTVRLSPSPVSILVGLAAGAAAAFGLTTEGPLSLIGVMVAAALVPAAATAGIALAWGESLVALGAVLLLLATYLSINVAVLSTLLVLNYRPENGLSALLFPERVSAAAFVLAVLLVVAATGATAAAAFEQSAHEQNVNRAVEAALDDERYAAVDSVTTAVEYAHTPLSPAPQTVTVTVRTTAADEEYGELPGEIRAEIRERTDESPTVRVEVVRYREVG